jgi:hypothetical protein
MSDIKKSYNERSDLDKLLSQWKKIRGLYSRGEQSASIVRCATAAEIAANIAIRNEFSRQSNLTAEQVDSFLIWANGIVGKMDKLLFQLRYRGNKSHEFSKLKCQADEINLHRNKIVHQGEFRSKKDAKKVILSAKGFSETLVRVYHSDFSLENPFSD